jgi:hypothetical protein
MKFHALLIIGFALGVAACAEKEQATPAPEEDMQAAPAPAPEPAEMPAAEPAGMGSEGFIRHMHLHASHLEGLNASLVAGDLEAAKTPAYWLLRHEEVTGFPADWQPHIDAMHDAAREVTEATDIESARAAAQRITQACGGCHAAAGVEIDISNLKLD